MGCLSKSLLLFLIPLGAMSKNDVYLSLTNMNDMISEYY